MAPPELQGGKMPYRLYNLGGSLMNLMTAVIAYACSRLFQNNMILQMALLGLGLGIIISSVTTKYRDLSILVGFGVQLWMYATPVVYPISQALRMGKGIYRLILLNPVAPIINNFRYAVLSCGTMNYSYWGISWIVTLVILFFGVLIFNRVEKTFMDTV